MSFAPRHAFSVVRSVLPSLLVAHPHTVDCDRRAAAEHSLLLFPEPRPHLPFGSQQLWIAEGLIIVGRADQTLKEVISLGRKSGWPCPK